MFWIVLPVVGLLGKLVIDASRERNRHAKKPLTRLEQNLARLDRELTVISGPKIAIIGQPGAGKSSLLKKMSSGKVVPLPVIGSQTDATDWAQLSKCNLLSRFEKYTFADVPGYDTEAHPAAVMLGSFPFYAFDAFIFVIKGKLREADEKMYRALASTGKRVVVTRSFAESCDDGERRTVEADLKKRLELSASIPVLFFSNRTGKGAKHVLRAATAA